MVRNGFDYPGDRGIVVSKFTETPECSKDTFLSLFGPTSVVSDDDEACDMMSSVESLTTTIWRGVG